MTEKPGPDLGRVGFEVGCVLSGFSLSSKAGGKIA